MLGRPYLYIVSVCAFGLNTHSVCTNFSLNTHSVCTNFDLIVHSPIYSVILLKKGQGGQETEAVNGLFASTILAILLKALVLMT